MIDQGGGGNIVIVSSPQAHVAVPGSMAYNMAKAANDQMMRTAAVELLPHRIRVNGIYPGWTDTPGERKFFRDDVLERAGAAMPWGRMARPEEIAGAVVFLASDLATFIDGEIINVNGGAVLCG